MFYQIRFSFFTQSLVMIDIQYIAPLAIFIIHWKFLLVTNHLLVTSFLVDFKNNS